MAASFIQISDLARRMQVAQREGWTGLYAGYLSTALTSVANAPPTSGGVIGTAFNSFKRLVNPDFIMTLCGKSTIPLELKGKRVIFFQLDKRTQDAIAPVLATVLDLILSYNLSYRRDEPLVFVADEFPTLYLPNLFKLMAAERENGFVPIIGYQFNPQVENRYGRENTRIAIGACATKFIFNPQEAETAKMFAEYFGDEDVFIQSFSRNMGRNPSNSSSDQIHRRSVFSMRDILALPRGHCIYVNNAYSGRGYQGFEESGLPWRLNIQVPKDDIRAKERSEQLWDSKVRDRLIQRAQRHQTSLDDKVLAEELNARVKIADLMFPPLMGNDAQLLEQIANG
jgi:type IV secretory pathway TraG/TraD family ATPase VirD4